MHSFLEIALINAVMIVPLAFVAASAGRSFRRPALAHLLWVIVLVKLLTPPVWQIPLLDREWLTATSRHFVPPLLLEADRFVEFDTIEELNRFKNDQLLRKESDASAIASQPGSRPRTLAEQEKRIPIRRNSTLAIINNWLRSEALPQLMASCLMTVWGIGALAWFCIQGFRCVKFRWSLASGTPAGSELQQFANQLAKRLGLKSSPEVWLMPGVMSPMLWGNGQSTLLIFPEQLLDRLDEQATGTLLTHELAHFRRKDHWVRILSLMATGFFWWHPVVWWARREIEVVEEECCDALVLKSVTSPPKCYAEAILETIDFLAEYQLRLPPLGTGLGQFPFIRQRLTWIMRGPRKQDFGYCGRLLCLVLACNLPLQPTWLAARAPEPALPDEPPRIELTPQIQSPDSDSDLGIPTSLTMSTLPADPESTIIPPRWNGLGIQSHSYDKRFVVLGNKSTQILLDLETGRDFDLSPFDITSIAFSPNTNQFVTIDGDRFLRLWNAETCDVIQTWQVPGGPSKSVDVSVDARWIVTGGHDGVTRIWSAANQRPFRELPRELAPVNCVRFSPDGNLLAVATGDWMTPQMGRIALFNVGPWSERISMNWNSPAAAVAFRADGQSLTSGDWQGRIARWSIETGELLGLASGQKDLIATAEFSPSGSPLAEIEVPDLNPDTPWGDVAPREPSHWFFNSWPLTSPVGSIVTPKSTPTPP